MVESVGEQGTASGHSVVSGHCVYSCSGHSVYTASGHAVYSHSVS